MNIPEGYVLVPLEPTEVMLIAGSDQEWTEDVYTAMIGARPSCYPSDSIEGCYEHALKAMEGEADRLRAASIQAYDEAKERELFEAYMKKHFPRSSLRICAAEDGFVVSVGQYLVILTEEHWTGWKACAKSRSGIQS